MELPAEIRTTIHEMVFEGLAIQPVIPRQLSNRDRARMLYEAYRRSKADSAAGEPAIS